jgi:hypothetical protein
MAAEGASVEVVAKALVLAIQYVADRDADAGADQDIEMLERLAAILQDVTPEERRSLIEAADELGLSGWPEQIGLLSE